MEPFVPLLTTRDWNEEWKQLQQRRRTPDDASYWDKRSATFATKDAPNPYVERFLELAAVRPGETVLDMGCGTGALAIPLAAAGHKVVAADFSQGMLERLQEALYEKQVRGVIPKRMSWSDDWAALGVRPGMVDVCLASRSVATADMKDSLLRLTSAARRRVCITLTTGSSPRLDDRMLAAVGLDRVLGRDHLYAFNILANEGLKPELSYIESERRDTFASFADAQEAFGRMIDDTACVLASSEERARAHRRLDGWLKDNLEKNERAGQPDKKGVPQGALRLREPRIITWAFISWNK